MSLPMMSPEQSIVCPEDDGLPMAEDTLQFEWIVEIKCGLEAFFRGRPDVFVAGDLLWYPVEGDNTTRQAPDVMLVFGRPKGYRGSYRQWEEDGIAPQVVFEILSPGNRHGEMVRNLEFYRKHGVHEYYVYDPHSHVFEGWLRDGDQLRKIDRAAGFRSPLMDITFDLSSGKLRLLEPNGTPLPDYLTLVLQRDAIAEQRDAIAEQRDAERAAKQQAMQRAEALAVKLRALGIDPAS